MDLDENEGSLPAYNSVLDSTKDPFAEPSLEYIPPPDYLPPITVRFLLVQRFITLIFFANNITRK